jgi:hypothetical protein
MIIKRANGIIQQMSIWSEKERGELLSKDKVMVEKAALTPGHSRAELGSNVC